VDNLCDVQSGSLATDRGEVRRIRAKGIDHAQRTEDGTELITAFRAKFRNYDHDVPFLEAVLPFLQVFQAQQIRQANQSVDFSREYYQHRLLKSSIRKLKDLQIIRLCIAKSLSLSHHWHLRAG